VACALTSRVRSIIGGLSGPSSRIVRRPRNGTVAHHQCPPRRALDRCRGRSLAKTLERSIDSEMPWAWECARNQRCSSAIMLADARAPVLAPSGAPLAVMLADAVLVSCTIRSARLLNSGDFGPPTEDFWVCKEEGGPGVASDSDGSRRKQFGCGDPW